MKKQTLLFFLFSIFTITFSVAQITESEQSMSQGVKNAFVLEIPNTTSKIVEKTWKKFSKDFKGKPKKDRSSGEFFIDNANRILDDSNWNYIYQLNNIDDKRDRLNLAMSTKQIKINQPSC